MATINIGGENAGDAFYRYKMPRLQARIEGRGNGIKTNVVNCTDIAKALERPPDYILKFFGTELGAQTKYDKSSGNSIVNGAHDAAKLSELLEGFIKKYVQCYSCGNPETVVKIKKENILLKCKACGFVSEVDPRLKLNGYIVKNPPEVKLSKAEKKVKKAEKERMKGLEEAAASGEKEEKKKEKKKKKKKKDKEDAANGGPAAESSGEAEGAGGEEEDEEDGDDEVVWMTDTSEAAMKARAEEQLSAATAAMVTQGNIEAEAEEARKREAEAKQREAEAKQREAAAAAAKAKAEEEARLAEEAARKLALESLDPTVRAIRELVAAGKPPKEVAAVLKEADAKGAAARMRLLYEALFGAAGEGDKVALLLAARAKYLKPHAADQAGQLSQLVALEHLLTVGLPGRAREAPLALKALYDADLAEEDLILAWYHKADAGAVLGVPAEAAAAVRAAAKPFADWLEEADSGTESDDDE